MTSTPPNPVPATSSLALDTYSDQRLIASLRLPGNSTRRQRAELLLQLPLAARWDVAVAAGREHLTGDPQTLIDAIAEAVRTHPQWRPVACGARYLPCQVGITDEWGVMDRHTGEDLDIADWAADERGPLPRWDNFAEAAGVAEQMINNDRHGQSIGITQTLWKPSVVRVGDRVQGTCVTYGTAQAGAVLTVVGPIPSPDCGGYRYRIRDDEQQEHIVFAELLI